MVGKGRTGLRVQDDDVADQPLKPVHGLRSTKSVFLIDDHPVVALGLTIALKSVGGLKLVGVANTPLDGLVRLEIDRPDCVVIDLVFSGAVQLSLIRQCCALLPDASIIVFSSLPARLYARDSIKAGADAYMMKEADMSELLALIVRLDAHTRTFGSGPEISGAKPLPAVVVEGVHITPREAQVATRVGRGLSTASIALELGMSPNTVAVHRDNIRRKLNCRDTKELVARLARNDIV